MDQYQVKSTTHRQDDAVSPAHQLNTADKVGIATTTLGGLMIIFAVCITLCRKCGSLTASRKKGKYESYRRDDVMDKRFSQSSTASVGTSFCEDSSAFSCLGTKEEVQRSRGSRLPRECDISAHLAMQEITSNIYPSTSLQHESNDADIEACSGMDDYSACSEPSYLPDFVLTHNRLSISVGATLDMEHDSYPCFKEWAKMHWSKTFKEKIDSQDLECVSVSEKHPVTSVKKSATSFYEDSGSQVHVEHCKNPTGRSLRAILAKCEGAESESSNASTSLRSNHFQGRHVEENDFHRHGLSSCKPVILGSERALKKPRRMIEVMARIAEEEHEEESEPVVGKKKRKFTSGLRLFCQNDPKRSASCEPFTISNDHEDQATSPIIKADALQGVLDMSNVSKVTDDEKTPVRSTCSTYSSSFSKKEFPSIALFENRTVKSEPPLESQVAGIYSHKQLKPEACDMYGHARDLRVASRNTDADCICDTRAPFAPTEPSVETAEVDRFLDNLERIIAGQCRRVLTSSA